VRKVVVDTNIWVSALIKPYGVYAKMLEMITQTCTLLTAEDILAEAREVVLRPRIAAKYHLTEEAVDNALTAARTVAAIVTDLPTISVIEDDPDDNIVLACAIKAQADYVLSYDPHLTVLGEHQGITILTPKEFLPILKQQQSEQQS
jgi:putative PIN family toxin of toxin-antitoxin system